MGHPVAAGVIWGAEAEGRIDGAEAAGERPAVRIVVAVGLVADQSGSKNKASVLAHETA
jgi:hypothetical protein